MKVPGGTRTGAECERDTFVAATAEHDQAESMRCENDVDQAFPLGRFEVA